jgi:predicted Zn-dependent peptidase
MKAGFIMGQESNSSRAEYMAKCMIDYGRIIKSDEVKEKIENITINSISEVAEKLISSSHPVLSVIGPGAKEYKKLGLSSLFN